MDRRNFLQGVFGGVTAAGLIVAAKPNEIEAYASQLLPKAPLMIDRPPKTPAAIGEHLYNARGELVAIVRTITVSNEPIDVTTHWDEVSRFIPGRLTVEIEAIGLGVVEWDTNQRLPRLRGR